MNEKSIAGDGAACKRATLEQAENKARRIGEALRDAMKDLPGWGFTVILTSFGDNGLTTYLSSCNRQDMIKAMREMADHLEKGKRGI